MIKVDKFRKSSKNVFKWPQKRAKSSIFFDFFYPTCVNDWLFIRISYAVFRMSFVEFVCCEKWKIMESLRDVFFLSPSLQSQILKSEKKSWKVFKWFVVFDYWLLFESAEVDSANLFYLMIQRGQTSTWGTSKLAAHHTRLLRPFTQRIPNKRKR